MPNDAPQDVTQLLADWRGGDDEALQELLPEIYGELRQRASRYLRGERQGHTLQTHDLVHEAFLRLVDQRHVDWQNRSHFFAIGARLMRRILVDHARSRGYSKRGGDVQKIVLDDAPEISHERGAELVALDEALAALTGVNRELAEIVELRYFGGLKHREIAELLGVSEPTIRRRFRVAKAWLYRHLTGEEREPS
ncbi:MAG: sigma-70 family RNA polymerase sigma factor [Acidobacteriota bacterium]